MAVTKTLSLSLMFAGGILIMFFGINSCSDMPYTGELLQPGDVDNYLFSPGDGRICLTNGFETACLTLVPKRRDSTIPIIHIYPSSIKYIFYYEGVPILEAEKPMDTTEIVEQIKDAEENKQPGDSGIDSVDIPPPPPPEVPPPTDPSPTETGSGEGQTPGNIGGGNQQPPDNIDGDNGGIGSVDIPPPPPPEVPPPTDPPPTETGSGEGQTPGNIGSGNGGDMGSVDIPPPPPPPEVPPPADPPPPETDSSEGQTPGNIGGSNQQSRDNIGGGNGENQKPPGGQTPDGNGGENQKPPGGQQPRDNGGENQKPPGNTGGGQTPGGNQQPPGGQTPDGNGGENNNGDGNNNGGTNGNGDGNGNGNPNPSPNLNSNPNLNPNPNTIPVGETDISSHYYYHTRQPPSGDGWLVQIYYPANYNGPRRLQGDPEGYGFSITLSDGVIAEFAQTAVGCHDYDRDGQWDRPCNEKDQSTYSVQIYIETGEPIVKITVTWQPPYSGRTATYTLDRSINLARYDDPKFHPDHTSQEDSQLE